MVWYMFEVPLWNEVQPGLEDFHFVSRKSKQSNEDKNKFTIGYSFKPGFNH